MLAISAAFAAPLLQSTGLQSFGLNLFGPSKAGKTTALLAATSVIGIGNEADLPNWNATSASQQETARLFRDSLLAANEVGLLAGRRKDAYARIRQMIYLFAEGRDTSRHSTASSASPNATAGWRTIFCLQRSIRSMFMLRSQAIGETMVRLLAA
jgi:putative DNA primase/helicase